VSGTNLTCSAGPFGRWVDDPEPSASAAASSRCHVDVVARCGQTDRRKPALSRVHERPDQRGDFTVPGVAWRPLWYFRPRFGAPEPRVRDLSLDRAATAKSARVAGLLAFARDPRLVTPTQVERRGGIAQRAWLLALPPVDVLRTGLGSGAKRAGYLKAPLFRAIQPASSA
jgi:hypothetical protein